jgi:DNA-directed RNA polymerase specialized sigma24 family protein
LVDRARHKQSVKRGGDQQRLAVDAKELAVANRDDKLLALNEALARLEARDPTKAELVKLRYFAGLSGQEAAQVLGVSITTADRYWAY